MREGWFLLRLHSSLRSVPLLLGHFRADANKAVEEEGMARETRALLGRWQQFGRGGPAFAEILRKNVFRGQASEVGMRDIGGPVGGRFGVEAGLERACC